MRRAPIPANRVQWTGRTQDNLPLSTRIETELVASVEERVSTLETTVEQLVEAAFASGVVHQVELELARNAGAVLLEGRFEDHQVGMPVVVGQADVGDEAEFGIVQFVASVISTRAMRFRWFASSPAPRRVRVNFIIGAREE